MEDTKEANTVENPENSQLTQTDEKRFDNSLNILYDSKLPQIQNDLANQIKNKGFEEPKFIHKQQSTEENISVHNKENIHYNKEIKRGHIREKTVNKIENIPNLVESLIGNENRHKDIPVVEKAINENHQGKKENKFVDNTHDKETTFHKIENMCNTISIVNDKVNGHIDNEIVENAKISDKQKCTKNKSAQRDKHGRDKKTTQEIKNIHNTAEDLISKENSHTGNQVVEEEKIGEKHQSIHEKIPVDTPNNTTSAKRRITGNIQSIQVTKCTNISPQEQTRIAHKINHNENTNMDNQVISYNTEKVVDTFKEIINTTSSTNLRSSPFKIPFSPNKATNSPLARKRSPLTFLDLNSPFDIGRESLGILPNGALESVTGNLFNISGGDPFANNIDFDISTKESLGIINLSARESLGFLNVSTRESLGVLNQSTLNDLGRESIGIFDIKNSFRRTPSTYTEGNNDGDLAFTFPEMTVATQDDMTSSRLTASLNAAFLMSRSKNLLSVGSENLSAMSANPSFNSRSFEEPSKIGSILNSFQKTQDFAFSNLAITDPFNDAIQGSDVFKDKEFITSFGAPVTKGVFSSTLGFVRDRIHSLPVTHEEKTVVFMANDKLANKKVYDDSVCMEAKKLAKEMADHLDPNDSINTSTTNEKNFLDATPQPEWPEDPNESKLDESVFEEKIDKETILKKVDKMFAMRPVVDDKIRIKSQQSSGSTSSEISANLSRISRTSQGTNQSQNISRVSRNTRTSSNNVSRLISDLSQIIQDNNDLPDFFKQESEKMLDYISNVLQSTEKSHESRVSNHEVDSGHSSVDEQQMKEPKSLTGENSPNVISNSETDSPSPEGEVIRRNEQMQRFHISKSSKNFGVSSPTSSRIAVLKTPNTSVASSNSDGSIGGRHSLMSVCRSASVGYPLAAGSERVSNIRYLGNKKSEPLKAVIPIENMTRNIAIQQIIKPGTPPKIQTDGLRSKKTSTPIQEPKLKPMAASTPATFDRPGVEEKANLMSPMSRPRYSTRTSVQDNSIELPKSKIDPVTSKNIPTVSLTKYSTTLKKRNSLYDDKALKCVNLARQKSVSETNKITSYLNINPTNEATCNSKITKSNNITTKRTTISEGHVVRKNMVSQEKLSQTTRKSSSEVQKILRQSTEVEKMNRPSSSIVRRNSVSEGQNKISRQKTEDKIKVPIVRRNSVSEGHTKVTVNKAMLSRREKEQRSFVMESGKSGAEGALGGSSSSTRRFSTGSKDSKLMKALNKVRQNIPSYYTANASSETQQQVLGEHNQARNVASKQKNSMTSMEKLGKENFK